MSNPNLIFFMVGLLVTLGLQQVMLYLYQKPFNGHRRRYSNWYLLFFGLASTVALALVVILGIDLYKKPPIKLTPTTQNDSIVVDFFERIRGSIISAKLDTIERDSIPKSDIILYLNDSTLSRIDSLFQHLDSLELASLKFIQHIEDNRRLLSEYNLQNKRIERLESIMSVTSTDSLKSNANKALQLEDRSQDNQRDFGWGIGIMIVSLLYGAYQYSKYLKLQSRKNV